jgi:hypothetical protein
MVASYNPPRSIVLIGLKGRPRLPRRTAFKSVRSAQMAIAACAYWDSLACRDWPVCGYRGGRLRRGHVVDIWTRPAAVPLVIHIAVAILSTKIPSWSRVTSVSSRHATRGDGFRNMTSEAALISRCCGPFCSGLSRNEDRILGRASSEVESNLTVPKCALLLSPTGGNPRRRCDTAPAISVA